MNRDYSEDDFALKNITEFKNLGARDKLSFVLLLVNNCDEFVKWQIKSYLSEKDTFDLLYFLPPELQIRILEYVDGESLLKATLVSSHWNKIISGYQLLWKSKCIELGVDTSYINNDSIWQRVYIDSLKQIRMWKNTTAFKEKFISLQNCKRPIKLVNYKNGYLCSVAEDDHVNIWLLELNISVFSFQVDRAVSTVTFLPLQLLVCGHYSGALTSWDLQGAQVVKKCSYRLHTGPVFSCDFSFYLNVLLSGGVDNCLKLWNLSNGTLLKSLPNQESWIFQVFLIPDANPGEHVAMCATSYQIKQFRWKERLQNEVSGTSRSDVHSNISQLPAEQDLDSIEIKLTVNVIDESVGFFAAVLHASHTFVGILMQDLDEKYSTLQVCDVETFSVSCEVKFDFKVKRLLALGKRYALLLTVGSILHHHTMVVFDIITKKIMGSHQIPHSKISMPDSCQLAVGNMNWLDGILPHFCTSLSGDIIGLKQDRSGLILASAIQIEPGRMYTLSWKKKDMQHKE